MFNARSLVLLAVISAATAATALAADLEVHRDIAYGESADPLQTLDVYASADGKDRPVVVWIHGGGWRKGDKQPVDQRPQAFVDAGCLFVTINYRLVPDATMAQMMSDVAKAIRWVHDHATEYGGDPNRILVMGHSAGAHMAALVCTDESYLKNEGLSFDVIKGCVPLDSGAFDILKRLEDDGPADLGNFFTVFGKTADEQRNYSPAAHLAKDKGIPPFLIFYVADAPATPRQSEWMGERLRASRVDAKVVAAHGKTHTTLNSELGLAGDKPTQEVMAFLKSTLKK